MERPIIAAYWGSREVDLNRCSSNVLGFLVYLKEQQICPAWVYKGIKRTDPKAQVMLEEVQIAKHLRVNKTDIGKQPIPELGFSYSCWSGDNNNQCSFSTQLGSYSPHVGNNVLLELHEIEAMTEPKLQIYLLVLQQMISIFQPKTAVVTSHRHYDESQTKLEFWDFGYIVYRQTQNNLETNGIPKSWLE